MEANEKAKKDLVNHHASPHWRKGATKEANKGRTGKDVNGLSKEKRAEINEIKFNMDHPELLEVDPLFE